MRLIDADELRKAFEEVYPLATNEMGGAVNKRIYDIIDNAPTIESQPSSCVLMEFGKCSYKESGCSDCFLKERIRRALDEKAYEIGHADGARLGYEKGLKEASNYSEGWMDGYNHAIDQIFKELNYLLKNHVIEELRKRIKR